MCQKFIFHLISTKGFVASSYNLEKTPRKILDVPNIMDIYP